MATPADRSRLLDNRDGISPRNAVTAIVIRGSSLLATVLVPVVATRVLEPAQVATALVWLSIATILAVVVPLGLPWTISVTVASLRTKTSSPNQLRNLLRLVVAYLPALLVVLLALSVGASVVWPGVPAQIMAAACAIGVLRAGSRIFSEVGRGFGNVSLAAVTSDLLGPLLGLVLIGLAAFAGVSFSASALLSLLAIGWAIGFLVALGLSPVKPSIRKETDAIAPTDGIGVLAAIAVLNIGVQQVHIVLAGLMLASLEAAHFSTAARLATLTGAPLMIIAGIASPDVGLAVKGSKDAISRVEERLQRLTGVLFVMGAVLACTYFFAGPLVLRLAFGAEYELAHTELVVLSIGPLASLYAGIAGLSLTLAEKRRILFRRTILGSGLAVAAMVIGGLVWGSLGLAFGYSTGQVAINLLLVSACRSSIGLDPSARPLSGLRLVPQLVPGKGRS